MAVDQSVFRAHRAFIVLTVAAFAAAAGVWFGFPHEKDIPNIWVFLVKLLPFVLAVEAIAAMNLSAAVRRGIALAAVPVCFLVYFTYFVPKIFFGEGVYYLVLVLTPFLILALVLAFRLGGGAAGTARRLGYACILLQLSGLEDLAYLTINPHTDPKWTPIPEVWSWADHMTVRVGHELTKNEAFVFIGVHVVLAVLVLTLPDRFWRRLVGRRAEPAAPAEPETVRAGGRAKSEAKRS
ncbi:hypothetical protein GCM10023148_33860 [Actinokineospora soli]